MSLNPKIIKSRFEKSLDKYNDNATVQKKMAIELCDALISFKNEFENVIELGCGAGLLTSELSKRIKFKNYFANDITKKANIYIKNIIPNADFILGNALKINTAKKFDLVISNAMFQWLNLSDIFNKCVSLNKKDGILAFTTFTSGNFEEFTKNSGLGLDYKSKSEILNTFTKQYELLYCREFEEKLEFSNPLEMLLHMKNTGVNSLGNKDWGIKEIKEFCENMNKGYEKITLTYKPIIIIFKKL